MGRERVAGALDSCDKRLASHKPKPDSRVSMADSTAMNKANAPCTPGPCRATTTVMAKPSATISSLASKLPNAERGTGKRLNMAAIVAHGFIQSKVWPT